MIFLFQFLGVEIWTASHHCLPFFLVFPGHILQISQSLPPSEESNITLKGKKFIKKNT